MKCSIRRKSRKGVGRNVLKAKKSELGKDSEKEGAQPLFKEE